MTTFNARATKDGRVLLKIRRDDGTDIELTLTPENAAKMAKALKDTATAKRAGKVRVAVERVRKVKTD
jgi:hypothetical protein